jgi:hypothetical protein
MLDALGVVFCRDECECEGGCSVIWYSMDYVWVECRKVCKRHAVKSVFHEQCIGCCERSIGLKRRRAAPCE